MRFLDMKTDYAFKKVFGSENSKDILLSFLNSTLELGKEIIDLKIEDPYNVPKLQGMKDTSVDVKAILDDKTKVIIEMQILNHDGLESRILYNTAKNYANQLESGDKYSLLNPVIAQTILNFEMFEFKKYKSSFKLFEKDTFTKYKDDIELIFIELPKFQKELEECKSIEDKWIYFIKNADNLTIIPKEFQQVPFKTAFDIATQITWSQDELEVYDYVMMKEMEEVSALNTATKKGFDKGMKKWLKEGEEIGIKKGIEEGIKQGIEAGLKQGIQQGLLKAIELGLKLKFGIEGLKLYPEIKKIKDVDVLEAISEAIESAQSIEDIRKIYKES